LHPDISSKLKTNTYYLLVGKMQEQEYEGKATYNISVRDVIELGSEEEIEGEAPVVSDYVLEKVETALDLLGEKATPEYLKQTVFEEDPKVTMDTIKLALDIIKKKEKKPDPVEAMPSVAEKQIVSPELQQRINYLKNIYSVLGYDGFTLQAVKEMVKKEPLFASVQEKALEKMIKKVKRGEV
jgi:hypothetical protein